MDLSIGPSRIKNLPSNLMIADSKIEKAFAGLILRNPFFASLLLQQRLVKTTSLPTFAVDGKHLFYNEGFSESMSFEENMGVLVHELLHLALLHHCRMGNRDPKLWNAACDYAINPEVIAAGFKLPANVKDENGKVIFKGALIDPRFNGKSAEDIYRILEQEEMENNKGAGKGNSGNNSGEEGDAPSFGEVIAAENPEEAETITKVQVANARQTARMQGKQPGNIDLAIDRIPPRQDWKEILNRFLSQICARDYSFSRPNRRHIGRGIILPSLYSRTYGKFILAVDTSGSISYREVSIMVSEVLSILGTLLEDKSDIELTVIYWDSAVQHVEVLTDETDNPSPKGGGGTNPNVVFEYIKENNMEAEAVIFLTDGYIEPIHVAQPDYAVIWGLITNNTSFNVPFGETVRVDFHQ